jgi:NAD(P)-dependent dehydrogenase (short-subunit alcohol dehydrogenase family)
VKRELLIFGATGALGKGITNVMLRKNYDKIYLFDLKFEEDIRSEKTPEKIVIKDLSTEKNVAEAFQKIKPSKDTLFFLYSTVGGYAGGKTIGETDEEEWNRMMDMNLKANFFIAKYFTRLIANSAGGSICFTAAETGINPERKKAAYGTSKSALIHLVKTLSLEGAEINLSANAVAPYILDTPANRDWMDKKDYHKMIKPEEIGEFADDLFNNFYFISGNIVRLSTRFIVE